MKTLGYAVFPIVLQSPDKSGFTFFRRVHADGRIESKSLGQDWQPHDPPTLTMPLDKYLFHMTRRIGWKVTTA